LDLIGESKIDIFGIEEIMIDVKIGQYFFFISNSVFSFFLRIQIYLIFLFLPHL